jgi:hypothetical protein
MRYQALQQAIKVIVESHEAGISYFTGLEEDWDTDSSENYPAVIFIPTPFVLDLDNDTDQANRTWKIHIEVHEQFHDQTVDAKNAALDRTSEYLKDIILEFVFTYGDSKDVTFNNLTETLDFTVTTPVPMEPFINLGDNKTGWLVDFEIKEALKEDLCGLPDIFS